MDKVKEYWEKCALKYAHLSDGAPGRVLRPGSDLEIFYKSEWMDDLDFRKKTILDYGCGGAFVPRYLFENCKIKRAICVDIASKRNIKKIYK
jgi:hypothetical protein